MLKKFKKNLFLLTTTLLIVSFNSQVSFALSCAKTGRYVIEKNSIIYQQRGRGASQKLDIILQEVDLPSFQPIIEKLSSWANCVNPYGWDKNHAFYRGKIIEGVRGRSFRRHTSPNNAFTDGHVLVVHGKIIGKFSDVRTKIGGGYYKLGQNYFFYERQLPEPILKSVGRGYGIGRKAVYLSGKTTAFDPQTFETKGAYLRDKSGIYCAKSRQRLAADPATFSVHFQNSTLAADKNHFFFECRKVAQAKGQYLDIFDHGFLRDDRHVYFMSRPIQGIDAGSFVLHFQGGKYIQDKNGVYFVTKKDFKKSAIIYHKIKGADLNTFQATGRSKARDMMSLYRKERRTGDNWDGLKEKANAYFRVHRKRLYKLAFPSPFANNF